MIHAQQVVFENLPVEIRSARLFEPTSDLDRRDILVEHFKFVH